jgi:intracellular multiplication protein IcmQ
MSQDDEELKHNLKILKALDEALQFGPWEESNFLQATGRKLKQIRDKFKASLNLESFASNYAEHPNHLANRIAARVGQEEVFISLYNADGNNLPKWEKIVNSLSNNIVTRPIYHLENDIRALIRSKMHKENEAYVAIYISSSDVIHVPQEKMMVDRLGHELLIAKDGAVKPENIIRFMHATGRYLFKDHKLIRQGDIEYVDFI